MFDGKAEILEVHPAWICSPQRAFPSPSVIRMVYLIRRPRPRVKLTRREVFIRDNYTCQYCGRQGHDLTIDHIIPRSRGGAHTWDNLVSACKSCNHRKGGKSSARGAHGAADRSPGTPGRASTTPSSAESTPR